MKGPQMFQATAVLAVVLSLAVVAAAAPPKISVQGVLTDATGNPLDGTHTIQINIYDASSGGTPLYFQVYPNEPLNQGIFYLEVGPLPDNFFNQTAIVPSYLGVAVQGEPEMIPRIPILSVPYAFRTEDADRVGTLDGATGGTVTGNTTINGDAIVAKAIIADDIAAPSQTLTIQSDATSYHLDCQGLSLRPMGFKINDVELLRINPDGRIKSLVGGFEFPDGTIQTSAFSSGAYIQNQTTPAQTASFNIDGTGKVGSLRIADPSVPPTQSMLIHEDATAFRFDCGGASLPLTFRIEGSDLFSIDPDGRVDAKGGTFSSSLPVQPVLTFTRVDASVGPYWECENPSGTTVASCDANGVFTGNGSGLTGLDAGNVATGTLAAARMPTGGTWAPSVPVIIDLQPTEMKWVTGASDLMTLTPVGVNFVPGVQCEPTADVTGLTVRQTSAISPTASIFEATNSTGSAIHFAVASDGRCEIASTVDKRQLILEKSDNALNQKKWMCGVGSDGGLYWIKPSDDLSSQQVFCDMTTDGGGWTTLAFGGIRTSHSPGGASLRLAGGDGVSGAALSLNAASPEATLLGNLTVSGDGQFFGNLCSASGMVTMCSDARFKKDVTPLAGGLEKVQELQGVNYHWKKDQFPDRRFTDGNQVGLIAQDVRKILPELVAEASDGYLSVDYGRLSAVLVEAVKEQQQTILSLSARLEELEQRVRESDHKESAQR